VTGQLSCEWCRAEPATHLIVYDVGHRDCHAPVRVKSVIGAGCARRDEGRAREIAASTSSVWLFGLTPAMEMADAC
jgi:hypothetical protein